MNLPANGSMVFPRGFFPMWCRVELHNLPYNPRHVPLCHSSWSPLHQAQYILFRVKLHFALRYSIFRGLSCHHFGSFTKIKKAAIKVAANNVNSTPQARHTRYKPSQRHTPQKSNSGETRHPEIIFKNLLYENTVHNQWKHFFFPCWGTPSQIQPRSCTKSLSTLGNGGPP